MKFFLFFILLITNLYAVAQNKYHNIDDFLISENDQAFKQITYAEYSKKKIKDFKVRIVINQETLKDKAYYLTIITDSDSLKYTNAKYKLKSHLMIVKLDSSTKRNLDFVFSYEKPKIGEFRFNVINEFEYKYILPYEGIIYGLAYGIIFSAFLYYLVIYFSTRRLCFLYYSIMQFFVLASLAFFTYFSYQPYPKAFPQLLVDLCETAAFLFTFLFAKEVLELKKTLPFTNKVLSFFVLLNCFDLIGIVIHGNSIIYDDVLTYNISFFLVSIAGFATVYKGNKDVIFYAIGWFVLFFLVFLMEQDMIPLSGIYSIHIAAPLESLIFSFALAYMLKKIIKKQNEHEKMLIHKSKLASIGEMINNIAHQWRQPLTHLGYINMNLEMSSANNEFEKEFFVKKIKESNEQIKFMSKTIDDFRDFYMVEKEKQEFLVSNAANLAINIISPTLKKRKVQITLEIINDSKIKGYENEYAQVILNFLTNCVDIFISKKIEKPKINIKIDKRNKTSITTVCDNAGGIKQEHMDKIFEAYFTSKKRGSGIGLYMSQLIIKTHFKGDIKASNSKEGACFTIEV